MDNIKSIVKQGHISLATRTLDAFDDLFKIDNDTSIHLVKFRNYIESIQSGKRIVELEKEVKDYISNMIYLLDGDIPDNVKPTNYFHSRDLAEQLIIKYFGLSSHDDLLQESGITNIKIDNKSPRIMWSLSESGESKDLFLCYHENIAAYSLIKNVHEFFHCFQPKKHQTYELMKQFCNVPGYKDLIDEINLSQNLLQQMSDISLSSHMLNFFKTSEVKDLAQRNGIDINLLNDELKENIPMMNFLICYTEGEAYAKQIEIITSSNLLDKDPLSKDKYNLISLLDNLYAPLGEPRPLAFEVGIGLYEFSRNNPSIKSDFESKDFHKELTLAYFS